MCLVFLDAGGRWRVVGGSGWGRNSEGLEMGGGDATSSS